MKIKGNSVIYIFLFLVFFSISCKVYAQYNCNNNGYCDSDETSDYCTDCQSQSQCNSNGICDSWETVQSCPQDCTSGGGTTPSTSMPTSSGGITVKIDENEEEFYEFHFSGGGNCQIHVIEEDGGLNPDDEGDTNAIDGRILKSPGSLSMTTSGCSMASDQCKVLNFGFRSGMNAKSGDKTLSISGGQYSPRSNILCSLGQWRLCDGTFYDKIYSASGKNYKCTTSNEWQETTVAQPPVCSNNKIEQGEECDGADLGTSTCISNGFTGGTIKCKSDCKLDTSSCTSPVALCSFPGPFPIGFTTSDTPSTVKEKVGRVMMCYPPLSDSMDSVVGIANSKFNAGVIRHCCKPAGGPRDDTIDIPGGRIIDIIASVGDPSSHWAWTDVTDNSETPIPTCSCGNWDTGICGGGTPCISNEKYQTRTCTPTGCNVSSRCTADSTCIQKPTIISISPTSGKAGTTLIITGTYLGQTVQFTDSSGSRTTTSGSVNAEKTRTTITIPTLIPGNYKIRIYISADVISNEVSLTITGSTLKYTPDYSGSGYCMQDTQCLLTAPGTCIESNEYSNDYLCENGEWSSRTKLLALNLLAMKTGDYSLSCDDKTNIINDQQYLLSSQEVAANVLSNLAPNNFCIMENNNKIIAGFTLNKDLESNPSHFSLFKITSCSATQNDGLYHPCDSSNKVWYNKKLKSIIFSSNSISVPGTPASFSTNIKNPIQLIVNTIKSLIVPQPTPDTYYVDKLNKFNKLYLSEKGGKTIKAVVEGTNTKSLVLSYSGFSSDICSFTDSYNSFQKDSSSGINCKKDGNSYHVLAQGSMTTNINPEILWNDLTSKLRVK